MNNDLIEFKETQINLSDSTYKIIQGLNFFNINFNNNENEFLSLAYGCKNDAVVLDKFDGNGASIFRFSLNMLLLTVFILMLVYLKQYIQMQECRLHNIY